MKKTILTTLLFLLTALNFFGQSTSVQKSETNQTGFSDEEYRIWSEIWCWAWSDKLYVIQNQTFPMPHPLIKDKNYLVNGDNDFVRTVRDYYAKSKMADLTEKLFNDFNSKNDKHYLLERKFSGCKNYVLVSKSDLSNIFEKSSDGWKDFNTKYPKSGAILRFSRVGVSPDKKQAIIYLTQVASYRR